MKIYSYSAAALFLPVSLFLVACSGDATQHAISPDAAVKVTVAVAGKKSDHVIRSSGQIEAAETAVISTRVMGFITHIYVKAGDRVRQGQLLVAIHNADMQAKRAQALAMVAEAGAALKDAQKDYDRYTELYKQQSASEKELENIALHYQSAKAKAETALQMQREAEATLAYTQIVAPFTGVIVQRNQDVGSMASPGAAILVLEQDGKYQISTSVAEEDIDHVRVGVHATIEIKSSGRNIEGKVTEVSPSSQMNGGRYMVKIGIPENAKQGLYAGMYAQVSITASGKTESIDSTILIPATALVYKDQLTGLYTISENATALLRWVRPGRVYGEQVEILSGLRADEPYILAAEGRLYNGVPVSVK